MKEKKDILKNISTKETSKNFSHKVMQDIYALENEKSLSKSLSKNTQLNTSKNFTLAVMNKIENIEAKKSSIKIFSVWQKIAISISFITLILISIFSKSDSNSIPSFDYSFLNFSGLMNNNLISIFSISMICISILLAIDFYLTNAKERV